MAGPRARISAILLALSLTIGLVGFTGVSPVSAAFVSGDEVVVFDGELNLRATPDSEGTILQVLADGTPLTVTGPVQVVEEVEWYPVITESDISGFVVGEFIRLATPPVTGEFAVGDDIIVDNGPLNLRDAAGTTSTVLKTLPIGATGEILAGPTIIGETEWYQIQAGADTGWVSGDFLAPDTGAPVAEFEVGDRIIVANGPLNLRSAAGTASTIVKTIPTGTKGEVVGGPTAANSMNWYQITAGTDTGWVSGTFLDLDTSPPPTTPTGEFEVGDDIVVANGPLNLRSAAGTTSTVLKTLPTGTKGEVFAGPTMVGTTEWYQIQAGADTGWVSGDFLGLDSGTPPPPTGEFEAGDDIVIANGPLNLRSAAGTTSTVLKTLATGTKGEVLAGPTMVGTTEWYQIQAGTDTGWVSGDFIAIDTGTPPPSGDFSVGDDIVVARGPLNLRSTAGTSAAVVKTLPVGATGEILAGPTVANSMEWYRILTGSDTGWVSGDFLALASSSGSGVFATGSYVFVDVPRLNLRSLASTDGAVLQTMNEGTFGRVVSGPTVTSGTAWYQINVNGQQGWVVGEYLAGGFSVGGSAVVADGPLNLRSSANANSYAVAAVPVGATVSVTSGPTAGGSYIWFGVTYNGKSGYLAGEFLPAP